MDVGLRKFRPHEDCQSWTGVPTVRVPCRKTTAAPHGQFLGMSSPSSPGQGECFFSRPGPVPPAVKHRRVLIFFLAAIHTAAPPPPRIGGLKTPEEPHPSTPPEGPPPRINSGGMAPCCRDCAPGADLLERTFFLTTSGLSGAWGKVRGQSENLPRNEDSMFPNPLRVFSGRNSGETPAVRP